MKVIRYEKEYIKLRIISESEVINMNNSILQPSLKPYSAIDSLKTSLLEVKEFRAGKRKLNSYTESKSIWNQWIKESENEK